MIKPISSIINYVFIVLLMIFAIPHVIAQEVQRVEINGQIIVDSPDIEGVTIFNESTNKGTVTNFEGKFQILVALNDRLEISALQFENFEVVITQDIIDSKFVTVVLVEEINKLPEIIILPYGLTGDLTVDAIRVKTVNPNLDALYFGLDNQDKIDFTEDYLTGVRNTAMDDNRLYYAADAIKIIGLLVKPLFKGENTQNSSELASDRDIVEKYSPEYLMDKLNIPKHQMMEFIYFVEDSGLDKTLLDDGKELQFLNFIIAKSKEFQANKNGED